MVKTKLIMLSTQHSWSLIPYLLSLFFNPLTSYVLEPSEKNFVSINSKFTHNIRDVSAHLSADIYHYHLPSSISKNFRHLWLSFLAKIVDNFSCSLFLKKWYIAHVWKSTKYNPATLKQLLRTRCWQKQLSQQNIWQCYTKRSPFYKIAPVTKFVKIQPHSNYLLWN